MAIASVSIEIDAPAEDVWAVVSDPRNLSKWDKHIAVVEGVPEDGLRQGVEYTTVMRLMALRARVHARVLEWEPPTWSVILLSGVVDATVTTRIDHLAGGRSRLHHEVDYHFRRSGLGEMAARSIQLVGGAHFALRHGALAQKHQIESGR